MSLYLALQSNVMGSNLVIANGATVTGYTWVDAGSGLGAPSVTPQYSRTVDSYGVRVSGFTLGAREIGLQIMVTGTGATDALKHSNALSLLNTLSQVCGEIRQYGGTVVYRGKDATNVMRFNCASAMPGEAHSGTFEGFKYTTLPLSLVIDPYGEAPALDVTDPFSTDTLGVGGIYNVGGADWTLRSGNAAAIGGGTFNAPSTTGQSLYTHTGSTGAYGDVQVTVKAAIATRTTSAVAGLVLKQIDASNYLYARLSDNGTNSIIEVRKVVAGVDSALSTPVSANLATRYASGGTQWLRCRIERNTVYVENWLTNPTPIGSPTDVASGVLSAAEYAQFGTGVTAAVGLLYDGKGATTITFDDFTVVPNTYRNWTMPDVLSVNGTASVGGNVPAPTDLRLTTSGGTAPVACMFAWYPRPPVYNLVTNGDAESVGTTSTVAYGWSAAAVTSVIGAATSITRTTTAAKVRTGTAAFEVVTPATTDTGVNWLLYAAPDGGLFRKGVTYTAQAYVYSTTGSTTLTRIKLGTATDLATETAQALTATPVLHTVSWTPAADSSTAYVALGVNAATATTFQFDDLQVYEGASTAAPAFTAGGSGPGIIPASAYDQAKASVSSDGAYWTLAADATYRNGFRVRGAGAITSGQGALEFFLRSDAFVPDEFAGDELDLAVFARMEVASTQTSLTCVMSLRPEGGTGFGAEQFSEFGASGKALTLPSTGTCFKSYYLGQVTMRVDRTSPVRTKLRLSFSNSGSATGNLGVDYLVVVPAKNLCTTQTGVSYATPTTYDNFVQTTAETTKLVSYDLRTRTIQEGSGVSRNGTRDASMLLNRIFLDKGANQLVVWPTDHVIDRTDSTSLSMAKSHACTVSVIPRPQYEIGRS